MICEVYNSKSVNCTSNLEFHYSSGILQILLFTLEIYWKKYVFIKRMKAKEMPCWVKLTMVHVWRSEFIPWVSKSKAGLVNKPWTAYGCRVDR